MVFQGKVASPHVVLARALGEFIAAREAIQIRVPPSDRPSPTPKLWLLVSLPSWNAQRSTVMPLGRIHLRKGLGEHYPQEF
ncbi:hypothetical protein RHMOL_Rhmol06G0227500 [Rhododendron molle]|uniref:Uncharacterized protein n=1 Tax=Rhododendron molle TaxID=49168 RepID=A0ACC0NFI1_RHOML|nr:hypothetical protein RHMOL_Rhmol06G0227500 [Rhododendron molle]